VGNKQNATPNETNPVRPSILASIYRLHNPRYIGILLFHVGGL
jgi:hypothetical protein